MAIRVRSFLVYQIANEISYAQSRQDIKNNEILGELRKIQEALGIDKIK
jgi:hypothetical protein